MEKPRRESVEQRTRLAASVEAYRAVPLYAKVTGYIKEISVDIGDRVARGQTLGTLDIPEMAERYVQAESELRERQAELAKAKAEADLRAVVLRRSKALRRKEAITAQALDEAKARSVKAHAEVRVARARHEKTKGKLAELRALMEYASIKAPFDGIVTERFVHEGMLVRPGASGSRASPLVTIAEVDTVRVFVDVPEPEAPLVDIGDKTILEVKALPGRRFVGTVTRFAGALDERSRTMRTEVDLDNSDGALLPGMFGTLTVALETRPAVLTLPDAAIHRDKKGSFIYVVRNGHAQKVAVRTGLTIDGRVELVAGVDPNAKAIISSTGKLTTGLAVKVTGPAGSLKTGDRS